MEISAKEIKRQADRLDIQTSKFYNCASVFTNALPEMKQIIESEDSNMAAALQELDNTYHEILKILRGRYDELVMVMNEYSEYTISNETDSSKKVQEINSDINSLNESLSSL